MRRIKSVMSNTLSERLEGAVRGLTFGWFYYKRDGLLSQVVANRQIEMGDLDCGKWRKMEGRKKWIYPKAHAARAPAEQGSKTETVEVKKGNIPLGRSLRSRPRPAKSVDTRKTEEA